MKMKKVAAVKSGKAKMKTPGRAIEPVLGLVVPKPRPGAAKKPIAKPVANPKKRGAC